MATFTNRATLSYAGGAVDSNLAIGEIRGGVEISKGVSGTTYEGTDDLTFTVGLSNPGETELTGITVNDNLGAFPLGIGTVYPLTYVTGSLVLYQNGAEIPLTGITVTPGPPLTIAGLTIPAGGDVVAVFRATPNEYAPRLEGSTIVNVASATGVGLLAPTEDSATVLIASDPILSIEKRITPVPVDDDSEVTYTFDIENASNSEATAADELTLTDTFDPPLAGLTVTLNGIPLTEGTDYTYENDVFTTVPGVISVPGAEVVTDPVTGEVTVTPGKTTLVITGTI